MSSTVGVGSGPDATCLSGCGAPGKVMVHATNAGTFPDDLTAHSQRWLLWQSDQGRKIPRNPRWGYTSKDGFDGFALASPKDPRAWWSFETARQKADAYDINLGLYLPYSDWSDWSDDDEQAPDPTAWRDREPHVGLLDLDDVRDPGNGRVAPPARALLDACKATYGEWSPSGTGAHVLGRFTLPESLTSLSINLSSPGWPNASLELYTGGRFTTVTGEHIPGMRRSTRDIQSAIDVLLDQHDAAVEAALERSSGAEPSTSDAATTGVPEQLEDLEQTTDIDVIYEMIERTTPADVYLDSPVTEVRGDGSRSRDPSWADSTSGTRLAEFDDGWMWREGEIPLDALQVVALEEGILADPAEYPRGSDWWDAVDALRDRGVRIPDLVSD